MSTSENAIDATLWRRDMIDLESALIKASKERDRRASFDDDRQELGWVLYERGVMHDAVNRLRARQGKPGVTPDRIEIAERSAAGHIDYGKKFAIRCADLVHSD